MVDSISSKTVGSVERRVAPVASTVAAPVVTTVAAKPEETVSTLSGIARSLAASAPVDTDRVATIKKAIADGKFPILPATIADRLLALSLQWNPNDQA